MDADLRRHLLLRLSAMKAEAEQWRPHWRELHEFVRPRNSRFFVSDRQKAGNLRNSGIFNNTATTSLRTLASGMMSGNTSPARPWFQLRTADPDLNKYHPVKEWLEQARKAMAEVFIKSNLYTILPSVYSDLGLCGTSAFSVLEDPHTVIRCRHFPVGSYMISCDHRGVVDTFYRQFQMNAQQLIGAFGEDACSDAVKTCQSKSSLSWFNVTHAIEANPEWDERRLDSRFRQYRSLYWEDDSQTDKYLEHRGYSEFPIIAPRWDVTGEDNYGTSPGMDALGDIKALQLEEKRKAKAIDKMSDPTMNAPETMRQSGVSVLPGDVNFMANMMPGSQKIEPAYQIDPRINELMMDIQACEARIRRAFYEDLFLMLESDGRTNRTAYEIAQKMEEKMLALGPVYLRLNDEMLDPLVSRTFAIMWRAGMFPPPPPELQDAGEIQIEYISVMAQTMKAIGVASIERAVTFVGSMAQAFPQVLDKINPDATVDEYAEMTGVPPRMVYDDETANRMRAAREQRAQAAQAMEAAQKGAAAARDLSSASLGDNNALAQLLGRVQPQGALA